MELKDAYFDVEDFENPVYKGSSKDPQKCTLYKAFA